MRAEILDPLKRRSAFLANHWLLYLPGDRPLVVLRGDRQPLRRHLRVGNLHRWNLFAGLSHLPLRLFPTDAVPVPVDLDLRAMHGSSVFRSGRNAEEEAPRLNIFAPQTGARSILRHHLD